MYQLIRILSVPELLYRQIPTLAASFTIAELFYKFHSFTLECAAFLATWFLLDAIAQVIVPLKATDRGRRHK
jgi:hypothetical protein